MPKSNQQEAILETLGDPTARRILLELNRAEQDAHQLVLRTGLPQSSVYRKLKDLTDLGIVRIARFAFTADGKKVEVYRSRLQEVRVLLSGVTLRVEVVLRSDGAERLGEMWRAVRAVGK